MELQFPADAHDSLVRSGRNIWRGWTLAFLGALLTVSPFPFDCNPVAP